MMPALANYQNQTGAMTHIIGEGERCWAETCRPPDVLPALGHQLPLTAVSVQVPQVMITVCVCRTN